MRHSKLIVAIGLTVLLCVPVVVSAQSADESRVAESCSVIRSNLQKLYGRDLVSRTNRGRAYERLLTQVEAFSERIRNNRLSSGPTDQINSDLRNGIDDFRAAYVRYDDALTKLLSVDCAKKPKDFIEQLNRTRNLRDALGDQVNKISTITTKYRSAVKELESTIKKSGTVNG